MSKKIPTDKLATVKETYSYIGLYVLQCLELRALASKRLKFEVSKDVLSKVGIEIMLDKRHNNGGTDVIRGVIALAKRSGYLLIIQEKDKNYIFFPHLKAGDKKTVLSGKKVVKVVDIRKARPKDVAEVALFMESLLDKDDAVFDMTEEATKFWDHWTELGWKRKGGAIKDWKATARKWMRNKKDWDEQKRDTGNRTASGAMAL